MTIQKDAAIKKLRKFFIVKRRSPSYQEVANLLGFASKNAAFKYIEKLIEDGLVEKDTNGKIIPKSLFELPHLGRIQAGYPTLNEAIHDGNLDLYHYLLTISDSSFSLTVRGDSMKDAGIHDGDIVIIDKDKQFKIGDIVASLVDNEWTVKYIEKDQNGEFCLVPANPKYPVIYPKENLQIGGVVISVIRKYR